MLISLFYLGRASSFASRAYEQRGHAPHSAAAIQLERLEGVRNQALNGATIATTSSKLASAPVK